MLAEIEAKAEWKTFFQTLLDLLFVFLEPLQQYSLMVKIEQNVLFKTTGVIEQGGDFFFFFYVFTRY